MFVQFPADLPRTKQVGAEKTQVRPAIHPSLHQLQLCVLPLGLAVRPRLRQCRAYGGTILDAALREGSQQAGRGIGDPSVQIGTCVTFDHAVEPIDEIETHDERRDGALDSRHCEGDGLGQ
jgi:hypothetical protein